MRSLLSTKCIFYCAFLTIVLCFNSGCLNKFYTGIEGNLPESALVGNWIATEDSIEFLKANKICCADKEIKLSLNSDRTFQLANMPDCWEDSFGECKGSVFSYKGTWLIYSEDEKSYKRLHLKTEGKTVSIPLIKRNGNVEIVFSFGDPDEGREIYLKKL